MESNHRIAVLPFSNFSPEQGCEYFCDGITESIMTRLAQCRNILVTSRTSTFAFKNKVADIRSIGQQLGVDYILEGSVRIIAEKVRISAQLIDVKTGFQSWSEQFNRLLDDVLEVEDELSRKISTQLQAELQGTKVPTPLSLSQQNVKAYDAYLKGNFFFNKYTFDDVKQAIHFYEAAIEHDPAFAKAFCGLSNCYFYLGNYGGMDSQLAYSKSQQLAEKVLSLNSNEIEAHVRIATIKMYNERNWESAGISLSTAIDLEGEYATVYTKYAWYLCGLGQFELALEYLNKALEYDPLSLIIITAIGDVYRYIENYQEAINWYKKTLSLNPNFRLALENIGIMYIHLKNYEKGLYYLKEYRKKVQNPLGGFASLGYGYAKAGNLKKAQECLANVQLRQKKEPNKNLDPDFMSLYIGLGNYDQALLHLEKMLQSGMGIVFMLADPLIKDLKKKKAYHDLLSQIHFGSPIIRPFISSAPKQLTIQSDLKEKLYIIPENFLYAEAQNNYSKIVWKENNLLKEKLLRISLSKLEEQLSSPNILRCHRSFLVNLNAPLHLKGNARNPKLICTIFNYELPISRAMAKVIHEKTPFGNQN